MTLLLALLLSSAQAQDPAAEAPAAEAPAAEAPEVVVTEADFGCLQDWPLVGRTRLANVQGQLDAAVAVARDPAGGSYPPGTIVQLMPTEAMVKHRPGWKPETDDWEYLKLKVDKKGAVSIKQRGGTEVRNIAGGCASCHTTEPAFDHVCMEDHGCKPLPGFIVSAALRAVDKDPRCAAD